MATMTLIRWSIFLVFLSGLCVESRITCRDNNNQPVDWYIIYKLPVNYSSPANKDWPFPPHLYTDSNNQTAQYLKQSLNDTNQALAYTLQQAYDNRRSPDVGYIMYNDEKPVEAGGNYTTDYGHTKGVTIFDKDSGIWLVHSAPKFPPPTNSTYNFASNAVYYGQHFFCFQVNSAKDVANIGNQLLYNEPWIYDYHLPVLLKFLYPVMMKVIHEVRTTEPSNIVLLANTFLSFAKNRKFDADLYANLVANTLQCSLSAETWQHGTTNLPPACNQTYQVWNVDMIQDDSYGIKFDNYYDHSKFAVCKTSSTSNMFVCIGDINRQEHQMYRGGGTVCFNNKVVWQQYSAMIAEVKGCSNV